MVRRSLTQVTTTVARHRGRFWKLGVWPSGTSTLGAWAWPQALLFWVCSGSTEEEVRKRSFLRNGCGGSMFQGWQMACSLGPGHPCLTRGRPVRLRC